MSLVEGYLGICNILAAGFKSSGFQKEHDQLKSKANELKGNTQYSQNLWQLCHNTIDYLLNEPPWTEVAVMYALAKDMEVILENLETEQLTPKQVADQFLSWRRKRGYQKIGAEALRLISLSKDDRSHELTKEAQSAFTEEECQIVAEKSLEALKGNRNFRSYISGLRSAMRNLSRAKTESRIDDVLTIVS